MIKCNPLHTEGRSCMEAAAELAAMEKALTALEGLDQEGRERTVMWLASALGVRVGGAIPAAATPAAGVQVGSLDASSPKQFLAAKKPRTAVERVTCLAFFMAHAREKPHFKTSDLSQLNLEAAGPPFSNISQAAKDAVKAYYLASAGKQNRQITPLGEAVVTALPDRERVKQAVRDESPSVPRRRSRAQSRSPRSST
jgi:hypothetical protein